jgi:hypothetical protein
VSRDGTSFFPIPGPALRILQNGGEAGVYEGVNAELPMVLEETSMGALLVPARDLPFNTKYPVVDRFGVVALVGDFLSVLLGVRERDEDPDMEKRWGVLGRPRPGSVHPKTWSTDLGFAPDGPLVGGTMARGSASMTSTARSCSKFSVRERAGVGESGRQMIWLFFDIGAMARCWW